MIRNEKTHNQKMRETISAELLKLSLEIGDVKVPLLGNTERIILECNGTAVAKVIPHFCVVK